MSSSLNMAPLVKAAEYAKTVLKNVELVIPYVALCLISTVEQMRQQDDRDAESLLRLMWKVLDTMVMVPAFTCPHCRAQMSGVPPELVGQEGIDPKAINVAAPAINMAMDAYFQYRGDFRAGITHYMRVMQRQGVKDLEELAKARDCVAAELAALLKDVIKEPRSG